MAARKGRKSSGGFFTQARVFAFAKVTALLMAGAVVGYAWRSFYPLALPFESRLVSDRTSHDMDQSQLAELARAANQRAERAEKQRDELKREIDGLKTNTQQAERDLADMQIKSMLQGTQ